MAIQPSRPISQPAPRPSEFGRAVARILCIVFGILGALPLGAGFFARSDFAQAWLSVETARLLHESLGLTATYSSSLSLWPLQIAIERLHVEGEDGLGPAIVANRIAITPRVFSLIAGRLDVGDIELQGVHGRVVVENGVVTNLHVKLPETETSPEAPTRSPFRTFSASNVSLDLTLDGMHLQSGNLDLDVFSEGGLTFEASLGLSETYVRYPKDFFTHAYTHDIELPSYGPQQLSQWEEDRVCQLSARIRLSPESVLIRSFSIQGASDISFLPGDRVSCPTTEAERQGVDKFDIRARQVHIEPPTEESPLFLRGHISAKLPVNLMNRLQDEAGPFDGLATVEGDISYDGTTHLPQFTGKVTTGDFKIDGFRVTESSEGEVVLKNDRVYVPKIHIRYGGGTVDITDVAVSVLERGVPLTSKVVEGNDIHFPYMIRDLKVTPDTIINWSLDKIRVTDFKGSLDPPRLFGDLHVDSSDFEIFDRSYRDPRRTRMFGIKPPATLDGRFGLTFFGLEFNDIKARFGESSLTSTLNVRFNNTIKAEVSEAKLNLEEVSPLVTVPMAGIASLQATLEGPMPNPLMLGKVAIKDFVFGGFPLGELGTTDLRFRPLWVELSAATLHKGQSKFFFPHTRFDFQADAALVVKARMETEQAELRDFLRLFNFDTDPRWKDLEGATKARTDIDFVIGGPRDPCEHGNLLVRGELSAENATIFGQDYDSVNTDLFFHWDDIEASYHGMSVDLTGVRLTKGAGSIVGSAHIRPGANILGNLVATSVPINKLQGFGTLAEIMNGTVSAVAQVSGTLDQLETKAQVQLSPVIVGRSRYPASSLFVGLSPIKVPVVSDRLTPCKRPIPLLGEPGDFEADRANGTFQVDGQLFGGQVLFRDFQITRQNSSVARGTIQFKELDLGPLMEHYPSLALSDKRPTGRLSAELSIQGLPFGTPSKSEGSLSVSSFWVSNNGYRASLHADAPFRMARGEAKIPDSVLELRTPLGPTAVIAARGSLQRLQTSPSVQVNLELRPVDLKDWQAMFESADELEGTLRGEVEISGAWSKPRYRGGFTLRNGALTALDGKLIFTGIGADVALQNNLLSLENATANIGGGTVTARAQVPVNGIKLGRLEGTLTATEVAYSLADDIQSTVSANLEGVWPAFGDDSAAAELPKITGNIDVLSFTYKRPVSMSADISSLTRRGKRTEFESYDPSLDKAELDVLITSSAPFRLENNLVKASLNLDKPGLQLTGTNQRFGVRGRMEVARGGHIQLRRNEFEIQTGEVRFDDSTAITPRVDVTAITEYRRYGASEGAVSASDTTAGTGGTGPGQWRIALHAHGDADDLKIDLSSEPSLSQDDAFLLLTVGLTRAELDRAQSAGLGQSVALEALGSLTGADTAVTDAIPLIDDFGFGSEYSSQTGRTEPTVTISKRLSERVRAYVTSRLTEARDVRSNVEWTLSPHVSVQGSYDNINSFSTPNLGNLGADVRWRLEFE